jgi:hypothetical protein
MFAHRTDEIVVTELGAVNWSPRLVVSSGGHRQEGFVSAAEVRGVCRHPATDVHIDPGDGVTLPKGATVGEAVKLFNHGRLVVSLGRRSPSGIGRHTSSTPLRSSPPAVRHREPSPRHQVSSIRTRVRHCRPAGVQGAPPRGSFGVPQGGLANAVGSEAPARR